MQVKVCLFLHRSTFVPTACNCFTAQIYPHIPTGLHGLVKMFEVWTYSLFFCSAELWGAVVISVLAWSLANEVCTVPEAKTVYPLVGIAANVALVVAGNFMKLVNKTLVQVW